MNSIVSNNLAYFSEGYYNSGGAGGGIYNGGGTLMITNSIGETTTLVRPIRSPWVLAAASTTTGR